MYENTPCNYRYPLYVITGDGFEPLGAVAFEDGRYLVRDVTGRVLHDRKTGDSAIRAAEKLGRVMSSAWYGVPTGLPA